MKAPVRHNANGLGARSAAHPAVLPGGLWALARAAGCLFLALSLAIGYAPLSVALSASPLAAYAADDGEEDGDGQQDASGETQGSGGSSTSEPGSGEPSGSDDGAGSGGADAPSETDGPGGGSGGGSGSGSGGADAPGDSGGADQPDRPSEPDQPDQPAEPSQPDRYYVQTLMLKWDKPDDSGTTHFVGDGATERSYREIAVTEFGEQVQLRGWYLSTDGTGRAYQTASGDTAIGAFDLTWSSSDDTVATVSPDGLVTPRGKNGSVVVTATVADAGVFEGAAPASSVTITFDGQDGKYVKKVEILDENGKAIGEGWGGVTVFDEEGGFHQLHARVTWCHVADKSETVEVTGSGDSYDASAVGTTLVWNVSSSDSFTVNADTGRLKVGKYSGNAYVTCTAVGGLAGAEVSDTANVQLDTGTYRYNPADSLTLRVVWEERPDEVVKEQTFSLDELSSRLASQHVNATVVNNARYGVISAEGYLFKDVVALVAVDDADVLQYRFGTADGYDNPVSYQYLFNSGNRYYFPSYDIGMTGTGEDQIVPPLLAYKSRFMWNRSEADPNWELDEGTRFRLVFGCLASGDSNTSFQIYYIHTITIVLAGAPSAGGGGGVGGKDTGTGGGKGGGKGGGSKDGTGGAGHGKNGAGKGTTGTGGANSAGNLRGADGNGKELAGAEESSGGDDAVSGGETEVDGLVGEAAEGADLDSSKRWRVYQMMNKTNSDVPDWDDENPISPYAAPLALGTFAVGMGATGLGFRRRLR